jgi:hypothetical protein
VLPGLLDILVANSGGYRQNFALFAPVEEAAALFAGHEAAASRTCARCWNAGGPIAR